jgi:type IV secretion system protein VirB4
LADALDACDKLAQTLRASLARYEPEILGVYRSGRGWCSSLLEYLGLLINGEWQRVPLPRGPLNGALASTRLFFGNRGDRVSAADRDARRRRCSASRNIRRPRSSACTTAAVGAVALRADAVVLVPEQGAGQSLLQRQFNRMANAGDFAVSQAAALKDALDALTSNEFVMGDHHFSLQVLADDAGPRDSRRRRRLRVLNDHVAWRAVSSPIPACWSRARIWRSRPAFWAQLPGNFPLRPRKAPITSRNFVAMAPFHNYPARARGTATIGAMRSLLVTSARSPYHFSLHASDPNDPDGGSRKDTGHTLICGPTGSGKTVFIGFLIAMLCRQGATQVIFDKDRGLEILVRALGGEYLPLKSGIPDGLQSAAAAGHAGQCRISEKAGCANWPARRVPTHRATRTREQADLDQALRGTLALEPRRAASRGWSNFSIRPIRKGCMRAWRAGARAAAAIMRGCSTIRRQRRAAIDRASGHRLRCHGVPESRAHALARDAVSVPSRAPAAGWAPPGLLDGRVLALVVRRRIRELRERRPEDLAQAQRRHVPGDAKPSDVLDSPISRTLVEQTPTKVFFPNGDADFDEYTRGFGLTEREFKLIKEQLEPGSRMFLVKQSHHSVVCQLDLKGFDAELAVISGRASEVERMRRIITSVGEDPAAWLPLFMNSGVEHRDGDARSAA